MSTFFSLNELTSDQLLYCDCRSTAGGPPGKPIKCFRKGKYILPAKTGGTKTVVCPTHMKQLTTYIETSKGKMILPNVPTEEPGAAELPRAVYNKTTGKISFFPSARK